MKPRHTGCALVLILSNFLYVGRLLERGDFLQKQVSFEHVGLVLYSWSAS